jgi:demethylmenaquinone methyltransferase/2-methoxy-6-polyprenyl-1,4-benzoquinol methylase
MSKTLKEILVSYNKAANLYDLMNRIYFFGRDESYRSILAEKVIQKPEGIILVPCCGTGMDFPVLLQKKKKQGRIIGTDLSPKMLKWAKEKTHGERIDLVRSDITNLPFRNEAFNTIFANFCLKVTPASEKAVGEVARVLKLTGRIGILANHKPSGFFRILGILLTKIMGAFLRIDFEIELRKHLSKRFIIVEDRKMYGSLVQLLVGIKQ